MIPTSIGPNIWPSQLRLKKGIAASLVDLSTCMLHMTLHRSLLSCKDECKACPERIATH